MESVRRKYFLDFFTGRVEVRGFHNCTYRSCSKNSQDDSFSRSGGKETGSEDHRGKGFSDREQRRKA